MKLKYFILTSVFLAIGFCSEAQNAKPKPAGKKTTATNAVSYAEVEPLLAKYTCLACHSPAEKKLGPAYKEVAKRNYSVEKIVQLIKKPEQKNWPGYAVPMPPMPQVPAEDARKIAAWIRSLK